MIKKLTLKMFVLIQQCLEYIMKTYEKVSKHFQKIIINHFNYVIIGLFKRLDNISKQHNFEKKLISTLT